MSITTVHAVVERSQAEGYYAVAFSGDGFASTYRFFGTPDEIRHVLEDVWQQLVACEAEVAEAKARNDAARRAADEQAREADVAENLDLARQVIERCLDQPDLIDHLADRTLTPADMRSFLAREAEGREGR